MSGADSGAPPGVQLVKSGTWFDNDVQVRPGTNFTAQQLWLPNQVTAPATPDGSVIYSHGGGLFMKDNVGATYTLMSPSLDQSAPTPGALTETCHRYTVGAPSTPNNQTLYIMSITLIAGAQISNIGFCTGASGVGPTNWWACILNSSYTLMAVTTDQLTNPAAANTWYKLGLTSAYTPKNTGQHYIGLMFNFSGSRPSILAPTFSPSAQFVTGANVPTPLLGGTSTTGLTTPGNVGSTTYSAPTAIGPTFYAYCS